MDKHKDRKVKGIMKRKKINTTKIYKCITNTLYVSLVVLVTLVPETTVLKTKVKEYIHDHTTYVYASDVIKAPEHHGVQNTAELKVLEKPKQRFYIDNETLALFEKIVEAEVTGENYIHNGKKLTYDELLKCKIRVAQVFMTRVEHGGVFSGIDTVYESLTYPNATSTIKNGRYLKVKVTPMTKEAVRLALLSETPDYTEGALYFASGTTTSPYGDLLFVDDVGHAFFK